MSNIVLGLDVGGTGIKGALVDLDKGSLHSDKIKYKTPDNSSPKEVIKVIKKLISDLEWEGKDFGCGFPSIIKNGVAFSAANIDKGWKNFDISKFFKKELGVKTSIINDADAAGMAEYNYGAGKGKSGTVLMLTLGTGIGSGLIVDGKLVPNSEFGHMKWRDGIAEDYASNRARKNGDLSWSEWGKELNKVLLHYELIVSPDLIILGGGVSKSFAEYAKYFTSKTPIIPAQLLNNAGIIGAADSL